MKQYVNRNQAEKLKALGYHEPCNWYYVIESKEGEDIPDGKLKSPVMEFDYNKNRRTVSCPDVDDVCNWFRVVHKVYIAIDPQDNFSAWDLIIRKYDEDYDENYDTAYYYIGKFLTYDIAMNTGIDNIVNGLTENK